MHIQVGPKHRSETRSQRYEIKSRNAERFNYIPVCVNFMYEENVAFVIRSAACLGAKAVGVIGKVPSRPELKARSGGLSDRMEILQFANPSEFLKSVGTEDRLVAAELVDNSIRLYDHHFNPEKLTWMVVGHEETGVPTEILLAADEVVKIPMPGIGFCLNTSQTATILMYEYLRQIRGFNGRP